MLPVDRIRAGKFIYVVDDDADIRKLVVVQVEGAGYRARSFSTGAGVLEAAEREVPDLLLLDVMLGASSGFELCRAIRSSPIVAAMPVVFLTARTSEEDRITAFEAGADDYVTKPFSARELLARIRAVLRRSTLTADHEVLRIGELLIDPDAMQVRIGDSKVVMTVTEFRLLEHLARNAGRAFTREQLVHSIWQKSGELSSRAIDVYVRRIRQKIEHDPDNPQYLQTIRGIGYRLYDAHGLRSA